jgi:threonine synthase
LIDRIPRLAIVQAEGANPLYRAFLTEFEQYEPVRAETLATAIKIGNPVNYRKAVRAIELTNGVVAQVSDEEIMDAKALIDASGIGCEPASGCSLAGVRKLAAAGIIRPNERVVAVLTGHLLKDPDATISYHRGEFEGQVPGFPNRLHEAEPTVEAMAAILGQG